MSDLDRRFPTLYAAITTAFPVEFVEVPIGEAKRAFATLRVASDNAEIGAAALRRVDALEAAIERVRTANRTADEQFDPQEWDAALDALFKTLSDRRTADRRTLCADMRDEIARIERRQADRRAPLLPNAKQKVALESYGILIPAPTSTADAALRRMYAAVAPIQGASEAGDTANAPLLLNLAHVVAHGVAAILAEIRSGR